MRLSLRAPGLRVGDALRRHVERRLHFALSRFGPSVSHARVRLRDANGPRGGVDKVCQIVADLPCVGRLVVEDADADVYAAVDRAAGRLARTASRAIARRRELGTRRPQGPDLQALPPRRELAFGTE